ncbi:putative Lipopolysaccharide kinase (Kdo/WaaP) family-containing protein 1 [Homarus americanus]|uniref:Putative Lipopolysaccharide kinase (Kdo/WaaP) family-containing protein 1 n=1 Tax=Homarus americanus TaxID=6706 RepID=A0A8J5K2E4_HOMAM|nr:putative Lipopolysaccharide kinase (Kdo/WaaP) family-containing protein 1 [Homarus americanus]
MVPSENFTEKLDVLNISELSYFTVTLNPVTTTSPVTITTLTPVTTTPRWPGAGGAPLLYGVTNKPSALVKEFCPGLTITKAVLELDREDLNHVHYAAFLAIQEFHAAGYCHRDLHSDNILVDTTTLPFKCHIIDVAEAKKLTGDCVFDRIMQNQDFEFLEYLEQMIDQR